MAHAGSALALAEPHYIGFAAIDPADPRRVVVSTDVHLGRCPVSKASVRSGVVAKGADVAPAPGPPGPGSS
jgi:hypothetical protein